MVTTPSDPPECRVHVARFPSRTVVTDRIEPSVLQGRLTHWLLGAVLTDERGLRHPHPGRYPEIHERADRPTRVIVIFIMFFVGVWTNWFIGMLLGVLALAVMTHVRERLPQRKPPPVDEPRRITLFRREDREAYDEALDYARRFSEGWPSLSRLLDPREARDTLARTLWDVAEVLAHRQAVHEFLAELAAYDVTGLPAESPVLARIREERQAAVDSLPAIDEELHRHRSSLRTMAESAEEFAKELELRERERAIDEAIDSARRKLDTAAAGRVAPASAGRELAERTTAVLDAYRDLTARYAP